MAKDPSDTDQKVKRSVTRTFTSFTFVLIFLGVLLGWGSLGAFTLKPGEAAVLLLLGEHEETITQDGFHLRLPPPLVTREIVNYDEQRNEDFGFDGRDESSVPEAKVIEATMQTSDNNIVLVAFAVQYQIKDPFFFRYRIANPAALVRDAAQAAMREVVGRMTVDDVLRRQRALVTSETLRILQDILDGYESGVQIEAVQLQDVNAPTPVQAAFEDVVAANQDKIRLVNESEGYQNELLPSARAEAGELVTAADAYREAKVAEATGEAGRFSALLAEYRKAPYVTKKRLYLETMEQVLPKVEKVIIEPGTTQVLPYLPLGRGSRGASP
ncbi:MAG: FtsH protease activity modulator HflK [Deltaproteobacteria bacterium]|nr:FtsH protease activity modulator HflK [Deltaproteobacteria bacterium]MBW2362380.1 FtsH protease activity modulator HflK [Deltaproteobacteria bacterium]